MIPEERKPAQAAIFDEPFTRIPNHFLDHIAPDLTPTELRVMLYIYRHTLGYQKLTDNISYDQFMNGITTHDGRRLDNGAKVSRRALVPALAALEAKGLINRYHNVYAPATIEVRTSAGKEASTARPADQPQADPPAAVPEPEQPNQVQTLPLETANQVQVLHPSKEDFNQKKNNRVAEASSLIVSEVPGINVREAGKVAELAFENGRDLEYLTRLISYVLTTPAIHTPAAALTALVKNNQDRTGQPAKGRSTPPRGNSTRPGRQGAAAQPAGSIDFSKYQAGGKYAFLVS